MSAADPTALAADLRARLTGPGGEFELATESVRGIDLPVFVHRRPALREWLLEAAAYDEGDYLVPDECRLPYAAHLAAVASLADVFAAEYGVEPGDRVAIVAANSPD